jgi:hypothetical protein
LWTLKPDKDPGLEKWMSLNAVRRLAGRLVLGLGYPHDSFDRGSGEFCGLF